MLNIDHYRERAREILEHACNGTAGRSESDPFYRDVTEGRDVPPYQSSYSSCGDLPAHLWFELGVRCSFVNRRENARYGYRIGLNLALLSGERVGGKLQGVPAAARGTLTPESRFECGDVLVVWNREDTTDAHTLVVIEHAECTLRSADYGQPGGKFVTRTVAQHAGEIFLGSRQVRRWLPLNLVLSEAARRGELVDPIELNAAAVLPAREC